MSSPSGIVAGIVDALFEDEVLATLGEYTRIAALSPVFDPQWRAHGEIHRAVRLLEQWCAARPLDGARVDIVELDEATPVLFAEIDATPGHEAAPSTLIYGHFDKQPALGQWRDGLDPFVPVREGDRLYGRGTADDGYSTFAAFSALEALQQSRQAHGRVTVLIEGCEESGSGDLEAYLDHLAERIGQPGLVICLDSGCATYDRLWVTTSLRGMVAATLTVSVLSEGVHSGMAGGIVPSSFRIARQLLSRIEDETSGAVVLPELSAAIPPARRREIAAVAAEIGEDAAGQFPLLPGVRLTGSDTADRVERGTWRAALEVIGQDGMPSAAQAGNVLRPSTTLQLSLRLPPTCDAEGAARALRAALLADPPDGTMVSVTTHAAAGWDSAPLAPWLSAALDDASESYFGRPAAALGLGGSIPFMAALGHRFPDTQFVATGVLGPQSNAHGPNEFLHIPSAKAVTASVGALLVAHCGSSEASAH